MSKKNSKSRSKQLATSTSRGFKAKTLSKVAINCYPNEPLVLSERDSEFFTSVLENPPEPSQALLSVFE